MKRRTFLVGGALATSVVHSLRSRALFGAASLVPAPTTPPRVSIPDARSGEDVFAWLDRVHGGYDVVKYRQVLGAANPYKEGDEAQGLAADDEASRENSRRLLANTTIRSLIAHPDFPGRGGHVRRRARRHRGAPPDRALDAGRARPVPARRTRSRRSRASCRACRAT